MRFRILTVMLALLGGCVDTIFESQPGKSISQCDQHFVGKWRLGSSDKDVGGDENLFVVVDPSCKALHFFENGKDDAETDAKVHLAFASVHAKSILTVKLDEDEHADKVDWSNGYHYFLYYPREHEIHLHPIDDHQIARLIIDGKLKGRTEKISMGPGGQHRGDGMSLHNYVAGDTQVMEKAIELHGIFADAPYFILKPATDAEISASAEPSPSSK